MNFKHLTMALLLTFAGINFSFRPSEIDSKKVQQEIDQLVEKNNIPGLNFSIIYKNGEQYNFSSGYADLQTQEKLTPKHVMFSGSIGKTYAVAIAMQLVDEGKLDLKKKFLEYFPETGDYVVEGALNPININLEKDTGLYIEPNVWMVYDLKYQY